MASKRDDDKNSNAAREAKILEAYLHGTAEEIEQVHTVLGEVLSGGSSIYWNRSNGVEVARAEDAESEARIVVLERLEAVRAGRKLGVQSIRGFARTVATNSAKTSVQKDKRLPTTFVEYLTQVEVAAPAQLPDQHMKGSNAAAVRVLSAGCSNPAQLLAELDRADLVRSWARLVGADGDISTLLNLGTGSHNWSHLDGEELTARLLETELGTVVLRAVQSRLRGRTSPDIAGQLPHIALSLMLALCSPRLAGVLADAIAGALKTKGKSNTRDQHVKRIIADLLA